MGVKSLAASGDLASLALLLRENADQLVIVPERQAIQVLDRSFCAADNDVHAHIQIETATLAALMSTANDEED